MPTRKRPGAIIIQLSPRAKKYYKDLADSQRRPLKNQLEFILEGAAEADNPVIERNKKRLDAEKKKP